MSADALPVLFVDRDLRIVPIWPAGDLSNRIAFGERAEIGLLLRSDGLDRGIEEIVVIAVPARDGAPRTVLTGLADSGASRDAAAATDTAAWLLAAADPQARTREFRPPGNGGAKTEPVRVTRIRVSHAPAPGTGSD